MFDRNMNYHAFNIKFGVIKLNPWYIYTENQIQSNSSNIIISMYVCRVYYTVAGNNYVGTIKNVVHLRVSVDKALTQNLAAIYILWEMIVN